MATTDCDESRDNKRSALETQTQIGRSESTNQIIIRDLNNSIDNEFFGTFYTGTASYSPTSSVPEPSSVMLISGGVAGLMGAIRRKLQG